MADDLNLSQLSLVAQVQNNRLYYGQSETQNRSSVSLHSRYELSRYVYVGADIHDAQVDEQRQRQRNINAFAAADCPLTDDNAWYFGGSVKQRWFLNAGRDWNYHE